MILATSKWLELNSMNTDMLEEMTWEVSPHTPNEAFARFAGPQRSGLISCCVHILSAIAWQWHIKYKIHWNISRTYHWPTFSPVWWLMHDLFWCLLFRNFKRSMRQAYENIYYGKQSRLPAHMTHFQIFLWKRNWRCHQNNRCLAVNY